MIKKGKNELQRLKSMLQSDRCGRADEFSELFVGDLKDLISDYFEMKGEPSVRLVKDGADIVATVTFSAVRVKPFGVLPQENGK